MRIPVTTVKKIEWRQLDDPPEPCRDTALWMDTDHYRSDKWRIAYYHPDSKTYRLLGGGTYVGDFGYWAYLEAP
jgi:hypothetical protein